ncbi:MULTISPECIES: hypothetical protein [unclassified Mesorhizobium]|uniref:KGGVGR-motif variant AAA ATPase n=1 Tax=unclassified Mesorhizobium TaxID=325217 RepID=UPI00117E9802|nr:MULTISPECIES: hypothetical protein [unclassified Mesorhizobium]TIQ96529.1 MAG: hypothetical protein E5X36_18340 [Mesorhizobium sp.]
MIVRDSLRVAELISWVDVARRLSSIDLVGGPLSPPNGLISTSAYWSGLEIVITRDADETAMRDWLKAVFGSWLNASDELDMRIELSAPHGMETLPVAIVRSLEIEPTKKIFEPSAALSGERYFDIDFPVRTEKWGPSIFAFHSVKGGVGRTTTALAFSLELANRNAGPVLLVDADFEAPGVSFLLQSRKSGFTISLEDFLALAHADRSDGFSSTIDFVATRMVDQLVNGIYVLPVKRLLDDLSGFAIRPENLQAARSNDPFVVPDLVRDLAAHLGCKAAVVDLRAGLVDVSIQFLADPSVDRVFVSSTSGQSVAALTSMMRTLGMLEEQTGVPGRQPFVLFNQLPLSRFGDFKYRGDLAGRLTLSAAEEFPSFADNDYIEASPVAVGFIPHMAELIGMSGEWDTFVRELSASSFLTQLKSEMANWSGWEAFNELDQQGPIVATPPQEADKRCRQLEEFAFKLTFAETADELATPLVTPPLERLATDFLSQPPVVVVEGAKGTGKTLTARFLLERGSWRAAVAALQTTNQSSFEGSFIPMFGSLTSDRITSLVADRRIQASSSLTGEKPSTLSETTQAIRALLATSAQSDWLGFWLSQIAASAGFRGDTAWADFLSAAKTSMMRPVVLIEGLEEVLTDPFNKANEAAALASLLVDVPLRLREEAGRPVGYVAFVRADMIQAAITQNAAQFRAVYSNYALTWRDIDIKELVVWLVSNSGAIPRIWSSDWRLSHSSSELQERDLRRIWGMKLGKDDSREARTTEWVISVLTDLTGRLTARDLVRFVSEAAKHSRGVKLEDRLLAPSALKTAVDFTSEKKVEEYPKEVAQLETIFEKFKKTPGFVTPFTRIEAQTVGLSDIDLENLEKYGVAYQEDGRFEVPELFRIGLQMRRGGARPNIISLTRRARERARA